MNLFMHARTKRCLESHFHESMFSNDWYYLGKMSILPYRRTKMAIKFMMFNNSKTGLVTFLYGPTWAIIPWNCWKISTIGYKLHQIFFGPIFDDRLKEKFLKPCKGVLCIHFRVYVSVCTILGTEFVHNFCAGIGLLQLGVVLVLCCFSVCFLFDYYYYYYNYLLLIKWNGRSVKSMCNNFWGEYNKSGSPKKVYLSCRPVFDMRTAG